MQGYEPMESYEYVVDELSCFRTAPYQVTVEENHLVAFSPINALDGTTTVEFVLPPGINLYRSLSEMYLHVSAQVVKSNGEKYEEKTESSNTDDNGTTKKILKEETQGTLASNFVGNLFKDAKVLLNNQQILSIDHDLPIVQYVENCTNYDTTTATNKLRAAGIFPHDDIEALKSHTANSIIRDYYARLNLVNLNTFIIPQVGVTIRLTMNDESYYILECPDDESKNESEKIYSKSKVKIHSIKLYTRQYQVREDYNLWLEDTLNKGLNACYEFFSSKINTVSIPINTISHNIGSLYCGPKPSIVMFTLVENTRYIGARNSNPHVYQDHGLIEFSFVVNGRQTPCNTWQLSNSKDEVNMAQLFHQFHSVINLGHENGSTLVTYENFLKNSFFIAQDMKALPSGISELKEIVEKVQIGATLRFREALKQPLIAILYIYNQRRFEISAARVVTVIE